MVKPSAPSVVTKRDTFHIAQRALKAAQEKSGLDGVIVDISSYLVVSDYFVIVTGNNDKQVAAIAREVEKALFEEFHLKVKHEEGNAKQSWLLLDFGDVVVHIFTPQARAEYRLEKLWDEAPHFTSETE